MHLGRRHGEGRPRQLLWLLLRPLLLLALRSLPGGVEKSVAEGGTHEHMSLTSRYKILNSHRAHLLLSCLWQGRTSTAAKYGINEGAVESFCYACCCPGCSFIQTVNQERLLPRPFPQHDLPPTLPTYRSYLYPSPLPDLLPTSAPRDLHVPTLLPRLLSTQSSHKLRPPRNDDLPTRINLAQILVKENLTWGCCGIEASGGAPEVVVMER